MDITFPSSTQTHTHTKKQQLCVALALVAVASAGYQEYAPQPQYLQAAPVYHSQPIVKAEHIDYHEEPNYGFAYSVHDPHTGDVKSQEESRHGDAVRGSYSLIDADGFKRIVDYTADDINGFNAVVRREPLHHHVPVVAAPIHHAPIHHAPIHHAEHLHY